MFHALALAFATTTLTTAQIDSVLTHAQSALRDYVFPDLASKAAEILKAKTPAYEHLHDKSAFVRAVDADLFGVTHDKHVHLWYPFHPISEAKLTPAQERAWQESERKYNYAFMSVRRLPGNIGYLDLRGFSGDSGVGRTIAAAMTFLENTDALIIDLRRNRGGNPIAAQNLEAYFFQDQQEITSIRWRDPKTGAITEDQQHTDAAVNGPLYLERPVFLLTSAHTFSCAEQFTYDLHNLKRVTIVGETTGGGANPGRPHDLGNGFGLFIPEGRAYSPITKTNWEGTGIAPDVSAPAKIALERAYALALDYAKAHERDADTLDEISEALRDPSGALAP